MLIFLCILECVQNIYWAFSDVIGSVTEAVVRRFSVKKVFLEISQNSPENTCARVSSFNKIKEMPISSTCNYDNIEKLQPF